MQNLIRLDTVLDDEGKKRLGDIVRQLRGKKTQREFAQELGVVQSTLSYWESGKGTPNLENIEMLASFWGKTPEEFVAFLYGRKIVTSKINDLVKDLSFEELVDLQVTITKKMSEKYSKHELFD